MNQKELDKLFNQMHELDDAKKSNLLSRLFGSAEAASKRNSHPGLNSAVFFRIVKSVVEEVKQNGPSSSS